MVYLITGKQGAGKSTYAFNLVDELKKEGNMVEWIDGDAWRASHNNKDFTDEGRRSNLLSAAMAAKKGEDAGCIVVLSFIAPCRKWRDEMRQLWNESVVIYIPGGKLWEGTTYERPDIEEMNVIR